MFALHAIIIQQLSYISMKLIITLLISTIILASCAKSVGVCYCRYPTGEEQAFDFTNLKPREARQECAALKRSVSSNGGTCQLD